jgi:hypothetical protein
MGLPTASLRSALQGQSAAFGKYAPLPSKLFCLLLWPLFLLRFHTVSQCAFNHSIFPGPFRRPDFLKNEMPSHFLEPSVRPTENVIFFGGPENFAAKNPLNCADFAPPPKTAKIGR